MDRNDLIGLKFALGICEPWGIKNVKPDHQTKTYNIYLEIEDHSRLFGLFDATKKAGDTALMHGSWSYMPLGGYHCVVHAEIPKQSIDANSLINSSIIEQPSFLGHPARSYSNYIRQQIALAHTKGEDIQTLCTLLKIDAKTVSNIVDDMKNASNKVKSASFVPTEADSIWEDILFDKTIIKTNFLPFKLYLSKQKILASKAGDSLALKPVILNLRKFFIANSQHLDKEIEQLCGITSQISQHATRKNVSQQRLVLPSIKNTLWIDLLNDKLKLHSQSVPLNLLISRQRLAFIQAKTNQDKINAIEVIRNYIRVNCRRLKAELVLLNRAMNIRKKSQVSLPDPNHKVWQDILKDNNFIPSDNMAYKLLLASLRVQVTNHNEPSIKLAAAKRIRDFIEQNQRAMKNELGVLMQQCNIA